MALVIPSPDWSVFDRLINIFNPSFVNSKSSRSMLTNSDLLKPPENPIRIKALSLAFLFSFFSIFSITLIISFNSLIKIGFFYFWNTPFFLCIPIKFSIIRGCLMSI